MNDGLYDADFVQWAEHQARALRDAALTTSNLPVDWENVAEEIESLGKAQARELASRIETILLHLIKLQTSPATDPRAGWFDTIQEQRDAIDGLLRDSPSLRSAIPAVMSMGLEKAKKRALVVLREHAEQPRLEIEGLDYSAEQVVGDWFPG